MAAVVGCTAARAASPEAAAVVTALYQDHFAHEQLWPRTFERQRAVFAPALAALLDADARAAAASPDEVVGLDFDPLTDAQDTMESFEVGTPVSARGSVVVPVRFRLEGERSEVPVRLARSAARWRVTNIHYPHGDLVTTLRSYAADRQRDR